MPTPGKVSRPRPAARGAAGAADVEDGLAMHDLFTAVQQESTRTKVHAALREAIVSGRLRTGQKLTEVGLASTFKVSRSVVREALRELVRDGLVDQSAYKSTTVVRLTPAQVDEILAVRLLLETEAVRLVHDRLTEADRRDLKAMVAELERASRSDQQRRASLDLALHDRLWQISGNHTLQVLLRQITAPLFAMGVIVRSSPAMRTLSESETPPADHRVLINAVCEGSPERAVEALRAHVTQNWQRIKQHLATFEKVEVLDRGRRGSPARPGRRKP
jgi:DNA-binding GntR family transcriptional regulator